MSSVTISGDTSGSIILQAPAVSGSTTLTLPTTTGTLVTSNAMPTGSVVQVVFNTDTASISTSSTSYVASGTSHSITPLYSTSKILVLISGILDTGASARTAECTIFRNSTNIGGANGLLRVYAGSSRSIAGATMVFLDSPNTTSSVTYSCYVKATGGQIEWNGSSVTNTVTLMEIKA